MKCRICGVETDLRVEEMCPECWNKAVDIVVAEEGSAEETKGVSEYTKKQRAVIKDLKEMGV